MKNKSEVSIAMIVAMAGNRVIGQNNQLPWHLPNDLKYFRANTLGKPIIMGRKTFDSIGKPLPGRTNIVISGNRDFHADGIRVTHNLDQAIALARGIARADGAGEAMIIGGAQLYQEALPLVTRLYVTEVHANIEGDAYFPQVDWQQWRQQSRVDYFAEGTNPYNYSFVVYQRSNIE